MSRVVLFAVCGWVGWVGWVVGGADNAVAQQGESGEKSTTALSEDVDAAEPAAPPPPKAPPPSPFKFSINGTVAASVFAQDKAWLSGNGLSALFSPGSDAPDSWFLGGDIRQTRVTFTGEGPPVLWGARPKAILELEMLGGNQVLTIPSRNIPIAVLDENNNRIGTGSAPAFTSSAQGDESLLPRVRTAYIELDWNEGRDILRVGQYHHLLLTMISASATHPATLGYGAGQLGWRAPGVTYSHRFKLSAGLDLDAAVQLGRNNWADNMPMCGPGMAPPQANCLPGGVSLGEASMIPEVQARLVLSGPPAASPWLFYAPNEWQIYVVGHWDRKDLSGVGSEALAPLRDEMDTTLVEAGFKVKLGPILVASNGWYGVNAGSVFGHIMQTQTPDKPDVSGFGVWGQLGLSFSRMFSLWAFAGIDQPHEVEALAAGFNRLQNIQLAGMFAITDGTFATTLELMFAETTSGAYVPSADGVSPPVLSKVSESGIQPSITMSYTF